MGGLMNNCSNRGGMEVGQKRELGSKKVKPLMKYAGEKTAASK
jgi:hypothetical protein